VSLQIKGTETIREHLLELCVDPRLAKHLEAGRGAHRPVDDRVNREADEVTSLPGGGRLNNQVEKFQHDAIVSDLGLSVRLLVVWWFVGDLVEHLVESHIDDRVSFNEVLEVFDDWKQREFVFGDMVNLPLKPSLQDSVVDW